jgi:hypothetical protein
VISLAGDHTVGSGSAINAAASPYKNGGWQSLVRNDGTAFENQGDCVSFAVQGGTFGERARRAASPLISAVDGAQRRGRLLEPSRAPAQRHDPQLRSARW